MATTFHSANQARLSLKLLLANYSWYSGSSVETEGSDYVVIVYVPQIDDKIRKIIPSVHAGVSIKTDVSSKHNKQRQGY